MSTDMIKSLKTEAAAEVEAENTGRITEVARSKKERTDAKRNVGLNITYCHISLLHECISGHTTKALLYEQCTPAVVG